jgi:HNH endonuclease
MFEAGISYTRREIAEHVGGSIQSYLPYVRGEIVAVCLKLDTNPDAPFVILAGTGRGIERAANLLCSQRTPVPTFLKHGTNRWEYVGEFVPERCSHDASEIAAHSQKSGRSDITMVIHMVRVQLSTDIPRSQGESVESKVPDQGTPDPLMAAVNSMTAREGRLKLVEHFRRERNREIIKAKKQQVLRVTGCLTCEACGFDFERVYGYLGRGFCEVHHKVPLAEVGTEVTTRLEDLAILCANCHRMIHRTNPFKSIEELKQLVTSGP